MDLKKIISQLNVTGHCKRYGFSLWQCPQFLFLTMGFIIITTAITAYAIGTRYIAEPETVALLVLGITTILFIIANIIVHSFERLADANRMKSEFVKIVSHQLRSPLTNLSWAIDTLMSGELGKIEEKQVEYFQILKENSVRMKELTQDLLTVSKIEEGNLPFKKEKISLEGVIKNIILKFQPFTRASNVKIEFRAKEKLPEVFTNVHQIEIVLENLLDNAVRYIKNRGEVEITIGQKEKNLYFEIKDNGVGIPKEDQKYIFQKFFRAGNIIKYQTQGTGLGLYISKAIVENLGGQIGFKSQEGAGSTFWFTLPIKS